MNAGEYVELREGRGAAVRQIQDGWMVTCSAHDDRTPSLHVSAGQDGRVLLKCQAGCETGDVLGADELDWPDLFPNGNGNGRVEVATYGYTDEHGEVLFEVVRFHPKDFRQRRPNGEWGIEGVRRVLYRLPRVLTAVQAGATVYVCEGEKDVHALERAGVVATCNPMGAGKWRREYAEALRGATVAIIADRDEAGRKHAAAVARSLEGTAKAVEVVEPAVGKDAADHLAAGKTVAEFVAAADTEEAQPAELRDELAQLLKLKDVRVLAVRMFGNGSTAGLEIDLSNDLTIVSEKFGDLWTAAGLAKFVTQNTGIDAGSITKQQATRANALIRQLADVTRGERTADHGYDHGFEFLRWAPVGRFRLHDQADRYRAFALVDACTPGDAGWDRNLNRNVRVPERSLVLENETDGMRFVHCGHLFTDAHRRNEVSHPAELARQMTLAGWWRQGKRGRIKATSKAPGSPPIVLPFWRVPKGWEDAADD